MSTQVAPSSSPEASTSLSKPKAPTKRPRASSISGGKGKAKDESPGLGGADDGDGSAAEGGKKAKKGKNAKGAGPGKGWRAGRGGGSTGKRTRKKPEIDEPPNKYRDKFMALRDEFDLAVTTKAARGAELETTLETLNRIQEENDFLLDAARRSLTSHLSLAAALERTTSPERELTPMPTPVKPEPAEARIAGPVPPTGNEPLEGAVAPDDTNRRSKRQRLG